MTAIMSDAKKTSTPAKSETKSAPKPEAKSESKAGSTAADSGAASSGGETGKSARESVGGAAVGHYGFFSNIKTPEYKSGWDDIWGKSEKSGSKKKSAKKKTAGKAPARKTAEIKRPVTVTLDPAELPAKVRDALAEAARAQLKKKRINYDARDKAGAVSWQISCEVKR